MNKEILFDYNLFRDWPKPDKLTLRKVRFYGFIMGALGLAGFISTFTEGIKFEKTSEYLLFANFIFITIFGIYQCIFPSKSIPPFDKKSKHNFIKIDKEKIVWRQGFFHRTKTVFLSEIIKYEFFGAIIYLHTADKKFVLYGADIKTKDKKNELFSLLRELAKRAH